MPKIALYHYGQLAAARKAGFARTVIRAWAAFMRSIPATLRKRRPVQQARKVTPADFAGKLRTDYPLPSRVARFL
jgi:hypothetical protein